MNKVIRVLIVIFCGVAALVLLAVASGALYLNSLLDRVTRVDTTEPTLSQEQISQILAETDPPELHVEAEVVAPEDVTMPTQPPAPIEAEAHIYNILLIGQDRRDNSSRQRSDAMILCTVNTEKKTLVMTSFLRDMYVKFPRYQGAVYGDNRINVTYLLGGMQMLDDCLELNFGVQVDHNIEVDFSGFEQIVDLIGGVDVELTDAEARWVIWKQGGGELTEGWNCLTGPQALEYARIRKLDSDFGRSNRQRKVLTAILEKVRNLSLAELKDLAETITPLITTDMTNEDLIGYVLTLAPILSQLEVSTQCIPADGTWYYADINGMSVILPDYDANIRILKETIG